MRKVLGVMTGVALLASFGVANAGDRAPLTDAQLDKVVAGFAFVEAFVSNATTTGANNTFSVSDNANGMRSASINGTFATSGTGTPSFAFVAAQVGP